MSKLLQMIIDDEKDFISSLNRYNSQFPDLVNGKVLDFSMTSRFCYNEYFKDKFAFKRDILTIANRLLPSVNSNTLALITYINHIPFNALFPNTINNIADNFYFPGSRFEPLFLAMIRNTYTFNFNRKYGKITSHTDPLELKTFFATSKISKQIISIPFTPDIVKRR